MGEPVKILLVEDDPQLTHSIREFLEGRFDLIETASGFEQAELALKLYLYDCVIVDITLPDGNGLELLRTLKSQGSRAGVIIISARDSLEDKVRGLDLGADDYLPKPFHLAELNARLRAIQRRLQQDGQPELVCGPLRMHPQKRLVHHGDLEISLTRREFDLLLLLASNANHVLSKETIAEHLWGSAIDQADSFDVVYDHIKNLRRKLADAGVEGLIHTVYGVGYTVKLP